MQGYQTTLILYPYTAIIIPPAEKNIVPRDFMGEWEARRNTLAVSVTIVACHLLAIFYMDVFGQEKLNTFNSVQRPTRNFPKEMFMAQSQN